MRIQRSLNNRYVKLILGLVLILGAGFTLAWGQFAPSPLRVVKALPDEALVDYSGKSILLSHCEVNHDEVLLNYDWDGNKQWEITIPRHIRSLQSFPENGWVIEEAELADNSFITSDRQAYIADKYLSEAYRRLSTSCRLSPHDTFLGFIEYGAQQLVVTVYRHGKRDWRISLPISPTGPITGKKLLGVLVDDAGRVLLYSWYPTPRPIALVSRHGLESGVDLQHTYRTMVAAYARAIGGIPPKAPLEFQAGDSYPGPQREYLAESPYGRYNFVFDLLWEKEDSDTSIGRVRLSILKYTGRQIAQMTLPSKRSAEEVYVYPRDAQGEEATSICGRHGDDTAYFCPGRRRLLVVGSPPCIMAY